MTTLKRIFVIFSFLWSLTLLHAQTPVRIQGIVSDPDGNPLSLVNVAILNQTTGTVTGADGRFTLKLSSVKSVVLQFSRVGYTRRQVQLSQNDSAAATRRPLIINITLHQNTKQLEEVLIRADRNQGTNLVRIDPKITTMLPGVNSNLEDVIKSLPGVVSNNELSSQYSVRGGNFDENLVYINDIEIYRPFLIRSGQQEGLSFINPDLVSSVLFSAGGFSARYGDKMSSVLDIRYRKPTFFAGSVSGSLLGGSVHLEGTGKNRRFSYLTGVRYKSNSYLLNTLPTTGDYHPRFTDVQIYLTYDLTPEWELSFLGNLARNQYEFIPQKWENSFGTVNEALELRIWFDGKEMDAFTTWFGAVTGTYHPGDNLQMKWILSSFYTNEVETFDIQGQYLLNELDRRLNSESFADSLLNIGIGTFIDHARNRLNARVVSFDYKGFWNKSNYRMQWGGRVQSGLIRDHTEEWMMLDSAGYSLPYSDSLVWLSNTHFAESRLTHLQGSLYQLNRYEKELKSGTLVLTGGIRAFYMNINKELLISPRASISFQPKWEKDLQLRFSAGAYHQPPVFKEFRNLEGDLNPLVKAQKSIHLVGGTDFYFKAWTRPFKFTSELYYKYLWDLIPYEVDNVRIRYYGKNMARGYAAGLDLKINGQFVPGVESWASLSIMKTQEDLMGDTVGYIARPTDQRVNAAIFFQDYLPGNKTYKTHLNLLFGTGLPYGPPGSQEYKTALRIPPYRRIDLGFSKNIIGGNQRSTRRFLKELTDLWVSIEIFNLLNVKNTISHIWIRDISNRQFPVPSYLTGRRFNVKLQAKF